MTNVLNILALKRVFSSLNIIILKLKMLFFFATELGGISHFFVAPEGFDFCVIFVLQKNVVANLGGLTAFCPLSAPEKIHYGGMLSLDRLGTINGKLK